MASSSSPSSSTVAFRIAELYRDLIGSNTNDLGKLQKGKPNSHTLKSATAKNCQDRRKYHLQLGENELVLKELDLLNEDANVYKLIGPILVKQDLAEANANVRKRIEYITAELKCLDAALIDLADKQLTKEENLPSLFYRQLRPLVRSVTS
ncbi:hypothetical protein LguiA_014888 [Lonicera macranthoides]